MILIVLAPPEELAFNKYIPALKLDTLISIELKPFAHLRTAL